MSAIIIDGNQIAEELKSCLKKKIDSYEPLGGKPRLVSIIIGKDQSAVSYLASQTRMAQEIGIDYQQVIWSQNISSKDCLQKIEAFNQDKSVSGVIIQKPFPQGINFEELIVRLDPQKDVEGIHPLNMGRLMRDQDGLIPCTAKAVETIVQHQNIDMRGKEIVVVGHSINVGKPLAHLFLKLFATVTVCHIATSEAGRLKNHVGEADILIVAVGQPGLIPGSWIKKGAIVIDVGINKVKEKIVGDVEFDDAIKTAGAITPVPGGVGPVTTAILMQNCIHAFEKQKGY